MIRTTKGWALVVLAMLLACAGAGAQATTMLRYATAEPSINTAFANALVPFTKRVEKDSDGTLRIQTFPGGQLASARTTLSAIHDGTANAGLVISISVPSDIKRINAIAQILFSGDNAVAVAGATAETILLHCPECRKEMAVHDAMPMAPYATTPYYMQCAHNVPDFKSFQGMKIRIAGGAQRDLLQKLGASRVVISPPDLMQGLTRGQIDCAVVPIPWLKTFSLLDGVHYVVDYPLGIYRGVDMFSFKKSTWDGLDKKQRDALLKNLPQLVADAVLNGYMKEQAEVRKEAKAHGIKFIKPDEQFKQAVAEAAKDEPQIVEKEAANRGVSGFPALLKQYNKTLEKWNALSKKIGNDPDKFAQALWDNVYSKVPD